jgi:Fe-S cluster assembly protein SufD
MQSVALLHREQEIQTIEVPQGTALDYFFVFIGKGEEVMTRTLSFTLADDATLTVRGIVFGSGRAQLKLKTEVTHRGERTRATTEIRGILADHARAEATGWIVIPKSGHGADAKLEERFLLLSPHARAKAEPVLEILANDVKAAHAAAVSKVNDEQLFYLASRGIAPVDGRRLLTEAFIAALLGACSDEEIKKEARAALQGMIAS